MIILQDITILFIHTLYLVIDLSLIIMYYLGNVVTDCIKDTNKQTNCI